MPASALAVNATNGKKNRPAILAQDGGGQRGLQLEIGFLEDAGGAVQKAVAEHAIDNAMIVGK